MIKFSCAIIGLGQIGQGYDYNQHDDSLILTHATGFTYHDGYQLIAGVDPDRHQRERFEKKFDRPAYTDIKVLMAQHQPEIVSIAVPTAYHFEVFKEVIYYRPLAILCEKPIASRSGDARHMLLLAEENKCALAVNYIRRFEPGVLMLKQAIKAEEIGKIYKGTVWYSKGLLNNGSHFLDLLRFLLGEITNIQLIEKGRKWEGKDPEPDLCLYYNQIPVYFLAAREECFSIAEIVLLGSQGMIRYAESGEVIEIRKANPDPTYLGYTILSRTEQMIPNALSRYQWYVMDALYRHLTENIPINSNGKSATETLDVIEEVSELLRRTS